MDQQIDTTSIVEMVRSLLGEATTFAVTFISPGWRQYQLFIIVALILLSFLLKFLAEPRLSEWARRREGWPKWRLRMLVQVRKRLALAFFAIIAWAVYLAMQQATWPSRSYLIGLVATLATVWLVIGLASRLVQNRTTRRFVSWFLWIYATLHYLNLTDEASSLLDSIGFSIGEVRISTLTVTKAIVLIGIMVTAARIGSQAAASSIRRNEDISPSMQVLGIKVVQLTLYGLAVLIGFRALGFDLTGFALLSGAVGVGLGFGLQKVVSNLVSGVIILLDKSIKPGDVISLGDTFGWISSLTARYVSVVTRDGREYLIPNEDLITGQVVNWSHTNEFVRLDIFFGTAYANDPHQVRSLAVEAAKGVRRVLSSPNAPVCHIVGFGDSSIDYILRFWIKDPTEGLTNIRGNVYLALWDAFAENGIQIPFPQREVRLLDQTKSVDAS